MQNEKPAFYVNIIINAPIDKLEIAFSNFRFGWT